MYLILDIQKAQNEFPLWDFCSKHMFILKHDRERNRISCLNTKQQ